MRGLIATSVSSETGTQRRLLQTAVTMFAFILLSSVRAFAQVSDVDVRGGFLADSLKIGERTAYFLTARYPEDLNVLFPDSTHGFEPFEYQSKEYFLTRTANGISTDSTVYYLTTFEIDRTQYLSLPVYVTHEKDCTVIQSAPDSVLITQFVAQVPDTVATPQLPLKANTEYEDVSYQFNLVLLLIGLSILVALAIVVWVLFGGRISRYFRVRKLRKNHASFLERYEASVARVRTSFSPPATESALVTWKAYMEQLESRPYTKLTTKETLRLIKEAALTQDLSRIDKAIYGHDVAVIDSLDNLRRFADQQFQRKLKEVQHG